VNVDDLPTPALVVDIDALDRNLATMADLRPGDALRPHVKAHKCTALAARQAGVGHRRFTCATPREVAGMVGAGVGDDLLLANEVLDPMRLGALAALQDEARITIAVDSTEAVRAAADAGLREVVIDVLVGLPRCGCPPEDAPALADLARQRGMAVRGVMGYEGHLMMLDDTAEQAVRVAEVTRTLREVHGRVGGELITTGGTGTFHLHPTAVEGVYYEVQAGSYALMDSHYAGASLPFEQACWVVGTVISVADRWAVADVGLKALGMDHGNPPVVDGTPWFYSDEHVTFGATPLPQAGERVRVQPAHVDPTMAMHDAAWVVSGDEVVDRWAIDLRGW
jgi:D-serine deaminase-like pyridoxal phosphate-dependent protein